jgi:hypothetical protein
VTSEAERKAAQPQPQVAPNALALGVIVGAGILFDLCIRQGLPTLAGATFFVVLPALLFASRWFQSPTSRIALALVPLFGIWFAIRDSEWLLVPNLLCILVLLGAAGTWSKEGSVFRTSLIDLVSRAFQLLEHLVFAFDLVGRVLPQVNRGRANAARPVLRGLLLALPIVFVLGALLMSADSVFASLFDFDVDLFGLPEHLLVIALGAWLTATLLRSAITIHTSAEPRLRSWIGFTEAFVVLVSVCVLYAVFVITQVVVWAGGADHVLETAGLTYSAHARQGFFQLLAVGALTLTILNVLRRAPLGSSSRQQFGWKGLCLALVALTLVIVAVALHRLFLYESAYGLTMERLYAVVFAVWIGVVFVMFAISQLRGASQGHWFFGAMCISAMTFVLAMNVVNPEAIVVSRNLDRVDESQVPLDASYLATLSNDALAELMPVFSSLPVGLQEQLLENGCFYWSNGDESSGWSYNRSRELTEDFRSVCLGRGSSSN